MLCRPVLLGCWLTCSTQSLLPAAGDDPVVRSAVRAAFPSGVLDIECISALAVPCLLAPVQALCGLQPVGGRVVHDCVRLVASFVHGVVCMHCVWGARVWTG